jgi:HlyD family secretion protein
MDTRHVDLSQLADATQLERQSPGGAERIGRPKRHWLTRYALPVGLIGAAGSLLLYAAGQSLQPKVAVRVVPVVVKAGAVAAVGEVVAQAPGWVEPDPFPIAVSALADGVVQEVVVLEGQAVKAGDVVARLIPDDARLALARAEAELAQRRAELAVAQATLEAAQREWDNPVELTRRVATAEAAVAEKRAELQRWSAELAAEEALAGYYEAEFRRVEPLYEKGQASSIEYIQVRQRHLQQQATVAATRAGRDILESQLQALEAELTAARENLRLRIADRRALDEAQAAVERARAAVAAAQAARDEAALRLTRMEVRTPVDGVVMNRLAAPGSKLMLGGDNPASALVVRLYDPQHLQVRVDVPLADAAKVGVGQEAQIIVEVLPDRIFRGRVTRIVNEADVQKNTLQVKVAIENPSPEVKPEMLARARFLSTAAPDAQEGEGLEHLFVPQSLVQRHGSEHAWVWLADQAQGIALQRSVKLGRGRLDEWIEVQEGLQPGDRLIDQAPEGLKNGQRVRIVGESTRFSASGGS